MIELVVRKSVKDVDKFPETCSKCNKMLQSMANICSVKYPGKITVDPDLERDPECPLQIIPALTITDNPEAIESEYVVICDFKDSAGLARLCDELRAHDWTFEMSDDHRYWTKGIAEVSSIKRLIAEYGDDGIKVFKYFYPKNNSGCRSFNSYLGIL